MLKVTLFGNSKEIADQLSSKSPKYFSKKFLKAFLQRNYHEKFQSKAIATKITKQGAKGIAERVFKGSVERFF